MVSPVHEPGNGFPRTSLEGAAAGRTTCVMDPRCVGALAEERLRSNPYLALKNISCEYKEGILTLRGCLPTYYLRQMAQAAVAGLEGVQTVIDCIEVVPPALRGPRFP